MKIDDLIAADLAPAWFVPERWHMLMDGPSMLPVLVQGPAQHASDHDFATMQFTYLNTSGSDIDVSRVSTFFWDKDSGRSVLPAEIGLPFTLKAGTAFTCDRMVSRVELEAAL